MTRYHIDDTEAQLWFAKDPEAPEPELSLVDPLDVVDLHLPGQHIQKRHGSWSAQNPFTPNRLRKNRVLPGKKPGAARGEAGKPEAKGGAIGRSKTPVFAVEDYGDADTVPVYDNPKAVEGTRVDFVFGEKGGNPRALFVGGGDGVLSNKRHIAEKGLDVGSEPVLTGVFYRDNGTLLAGAGVGKQRREMTKEERRFLLEAFPEAKSGFINGVMLHNNGGEWREPFRPSVDVEHAEMARAKIMDITGLRSNWSGRFASNTQVSEESRKSAAGVKLWACDIWLENPDRPSSPKVLVHEMFHSFSPPKLPGEYIELKGWEEAPVEMMARIHEEPIIRAMYPRATDIEIEQMLGQLKTYNQYILPLDGVRQLLDQDDAAFYGNLFKVPLRDRPAYMKEQLNTLSEDRGGDWPQEILDDLFSDVDEALRAVKSFD